jgi:hypothetical protein
MMFYSHPFNTPCKFGPQVSMYNLNLLIFLQCKQAQDRAHMSQCSHPCWWGAECRELIAKKYSHCVDFYHLKRISCPHGKDCDLLENREHMTKFSHPGIKDIRIECKYGQYCFDTDVGHHQVSIVSVDN